MENIFRQIHEAHKDSRLYVQKIKLGDAVFHIQSKIITTEDLIKDLETYQANTTNKELRDHYQAKIDAYTISLDMLNDALKLIKDCVL
jgi:MoaA/NifB/PqqE/SkfB family radical SAM enzyme